MNREPVAPSRRHLLVGGGAALASLALAGVADFAGLSSRKSRIADSFAPQIEPQNPAKSPEVESDFNGEIVTSEEECQNHLRFTESHEKDYAQYLHSLDLTYIAPFELLRAHRNCCNGVSNILPPESLWPNMAKTLKVADELRRRLDRKMLLITSAYRSPAYNRQIPGAAAGSWHTKNCALDLVYDCSPKRVMKEARKMRREGKFTGGLGLYRTFVHLDTRGRNATWSKA